MRGIKKWFFEILEKYLFPADKWLLQPELKKAVRYDLYSFLTHSYGVKSLFVPRYNFNLVEFMNFSYIFYHLSDILRSVGAQCL